MSTNSAIVTVVGKPDGSIEVKAGPGGNTLARYIGDLMAKDAEAARSAKNGKPGVLGKGAASKALELELQAARWEDTVEQNYYMDADLRRFYAEKAVECRAQAARLRGETPAA